MIPLFVLLRLFLGFTINLFGHHLLCNFGINLVVIPTSDAFPLLSHLVPEKSNLVGSKKWNANIRFSTPVVLVSPVPLAFRFLIQFLLLLDGLLDILCLQ